MSSGFLGDTWMFSLVTNEWTWINGFDNSNFIASFGALGEQSAFYHPGSRESHSMAIDASRSIIYVMGGKTLQG